MDLNSRRELAIEELRSGGWLRDVQWLPEVDSTNSLAKRQLLDGDLKLPALIVADQQSAGRGRTTRAWWSPTGCLMFSLMIESTSLPADSASWPQLSLVTGVAAAMAVEAILPSLSVKLKWPNDLYLGHKKLSGILVEAVPIGASTDGRCAFIVGIGLNVAVDFSQAPQEVQQRACALSQFTQRTIDGEEMLIHLVEQFQEQLTLWKAGDSQWHRQWSQRSLLTGCTVRAQISPGQTRMGICEGITEQGYLMLRDASGVYHLQSADILHWE